MLHAQPSWSGSGVLKPFFAGKKCTSPPIYRARGAWALQLSRPAQDQKLTTTARYLKVRAILCAYAGCWMQVSNSQQGRPVTVLCASGVRQPHFAGAARLEHPAEVVRHQEALLSQQLRAAPHARLEHGRRALAELRFAHRRQHLRAAMARRVRTATTAKLLWCCQARAQGLPTLASHQCIHRLCKDVTRAPVRKCGRVRLTGSLPTQLARAALTIYSYFTCARTVTMPCRSEAPTSGCAGGWRVSAGHAAACAGAPPPARSPSSPRAAAPRPAAPSAQLPPATSSKAYLNLTIT